MGFRKNLTGHHAEPAGHEIVGTNDHHPLFPELRRISGNPQRIGIVPGQGILRAILPVCTVDPAGGCNDLAIPAFRKIAAIRRQSPGLFQALRIPGCQSRLCKIPNGAFGIHQFKPKRLQ